MSIGAFGENFPYINFHDLNMDWIIKTVKDFYEQYNHVQETIDQGTTDISDATDEAVTKLNNAADEKTREVLESIPEDYTELTKRVEKNRAYAIANKITNILPIYGNFEDGELFGMSYKWNEAHDQCTINGTTDTMYSFNNIFNEDNLMCFYPTRTVHFKIQGITPLPNPISVQLFWYHNHVLDSANPITLQGSSDVFIPADATGMIVRVSVAANTTITNQTITVELQNALSPVLESTGNDLPRNAEIVKRFNVYGYCELGPGDFYLKGPITMQTNWSIYGQGKGATRIRKLPIGEISELGTFIITGSTSFVSFRDIGFYGTNTSMPTEAVTLGDTSIIVQDNAGFVTIDDCLFYGIERSAIYVASGYSWLRSVQVTNCSFLFCNKGIEFIPHGEYAVVSNSKFVSCYLGVLNMGGNNCFTACNFDACHIGFSLYRDTSNTSANDGHGSCTGCTFNHCTESAIAINNILNGYVFTGCQFFYAGILVYNSTGIIISDSQMQGAQMSFNFTKNNLVILDHCLFSQSPATFNTTGTTHFIKTNCYYLDGTTV